MANYDRISKQVGLGLTNLFFPSSRFSSMPLELWKYGKLVNKLVLPTISMYRPEPANLCQIAHACLQNEEHVGRSSFSMPPPEETLPYQLVPKCPRFAAKPLEPPASRNRTSKVSPMSIISAIGRRLFGDGGKFGKFGKANKSFDARAQTKLGPTNLF